jgi:hypothetical protein
MDAGYQCREANLVMVKVLHTESGSDAKLRDRWIRHARKGADSRRIFSSKCALYPSADTGLTMGNDLLKICCNQGKLRFSSSRSTQRLRRDRLMGFIMQPRFPKCMGECIHRSVYFAELFT